METAQNRVAQIGRKARNPLSILIPVVVVISVTLLLWRPWYTLQPSSSLPPDQWTHVSYSHAEVQEFQKLADNLLDPQNILVAFLARDDSGEGSFDPWSELCNLNAAHVQSIQDEGEDQKNRDRLFLVTFSEQENAVVFRLRQLPGAAPAGPWSVIGYWIAPKNLFPCLVQVNLARIGRSVYQRAVT
jgi:hypothetical protein